MDGAKYLPTRQQDGFWDIVVNCFKLMSASWQAFVFNFSTFLMLYLLPVLVIFGAAVAVIAVAQAQYSDGHITAPIIAAGVVAALGVAVLMILLAIATIYVQIASVRGQKIGFRDAVDRSWHYFWRFIGLAIMTALVVLAGLILLIIPGILAAFFLMLATYVLIDKDTDIATAMRTSYRITKRNWKVVLGMLIVQIVINLPQIVPILGAIVTSVLAVAYFCLTAIIYDRVIKVA
jgi:hypothetical protein